MDCKFVCFSHSALETEGNSNANTGFALLLICSNSISFWLFCLNCSVDILNRFELRSKYAGDTFQGTVEKDKSSRLNLRDDDPLNMALSSDPKLAKLWKKAELAGFSGILAVVSVYLSVCMSICMS